MNGKKLTRRSFFKGGAFVLGSAAAAGFMPSILTPAAYAQASDRTGCAALPWEEPLKPISPGDIKKTTNADVVIIGAGLAGICAAISAKENGSNEVIVIDKNRTNASRGMHIAAFDSKFMQENAISSDYRQLIRDWVRWAQGRVNEDLLWLFGRKSGACMDWMVDLVKPKGLDVGVWDEYYKGPDYTEYPVAHIFMDTKTKARGNIPLVNALELVAREKGVKFDFRTHARQLVRRGEGRVTGVIAGNSGDYIQYNAAKGVIIATGDYASNRQMCGVYAPIVNRADSQIYFPNKCNTGDGHIMAMQIGGAMQKTEPHGAVIHLEAGAMSYGFLHVNGLGKRFKNEDVNTQSKSCSKLLEPGGGIAWTVYDADGLSQVQEQINGNIGGGLFYGQMDKVVGEKWSMQEEQELLKTHIEQGKVVTANSLDDLAKKMNVSAEELKRTVDQYNKLARAGNDTDYGKRAELMKPVVKAPFYAGKLLATVLTTAGGLHTNTSLQVMDTYDRPVEGLFVVGSAAGDFFAADYPTIAPGIGHGRCVTFGRLAGFIVNGKSLDTVPSINI